jgi:hypothetical protein
LKFKRLFKTSASQKQGVFVDLNFFVRGTGTSADGVLRGSASWPGLAISQGASVIKTDEVTMI